MDNLQVKILNDFKRVFSNPTLKKMSKLTGINITRLHRILTGKEMSITEFITFQNLIKGEKEISTHFEELINKSLYKMSKKRLKKIEEFIVKNLALSELDICHG